MCAKYFYRPIMSMITNIDLSHWLSHIELVSEAFNMFNCQKQISKHIMGSRIHVLTDTLQYDHATANLLPRPVERNCGIYQYRHFHSINVISNEITHIWVVQTFHPSKMEFMSCPSLSNESLLFIRVRILPLRETM